MIFASALISAAGILVQVNGEPIHFRTGQPLEYKGKVMVPLRGVFEKMGASVSWDGAAQTVTINRGSTTIKMTVGQDHALKNEETIVTQAKSILRAGTVYVPLRFLAESLDADVQWDGSRRLVDITTQATLTAPSKQKPPPPLV